MPTMMVIMISSAMMLIIMKTWENKSPMMMSMALLASTMMACFKCYSTSMNSFNSIMMAVLMVGGVVVLYMFVCSFSPNYPVKKNKEMIMSKFLLILILLEPSISLIMKESSVSAKMSSSMKYNMMTLENLMILMAVVGVYLAAVIMLMKFKPTSMRS